MLETNITTWRLTFINEKTVGFKVGKQQGKKINISAVNI